MALKYKVEKLEDVEEAHRALYKQDPAGGFVLDADGIDNAEELKRAKQHEVEARKKAEDELKSIRLKQKEQEDAARKAAEDAARAAGNVDALEKSWKEKWDAREREYKQQLEQETGSLSSDLDRLLRGNVAQKLASELAIQGSDAVLMPHILNRLKVEQRDGQRVTVVVDNNGQTSALTLDDLKKEFAGNKAFAPLLVGSKGSGGGASGDNKGGGAPGAKTKTRSEFDAMSQSDRMEFSKGGGKVID